MSNKVNRAKADKPCDVELMRVYKKYCIVKTLYVLTICDRYKCPYTLFYCNYSFFSAAQCCSISKNSNRSIIF